MTDTKLDIVTLAAEPGLVLAERIDYFRMTDGRKVVLPVNGVFDLADFEQQSGFKL